MDLVFISLFIFAALIAAWQFVARQKANSELADLKFQFHKREQKMETILNNAPIVFSAVDTNGIFHISEGKGLEKLGRRNNQSVGLSIYEMHGQNPVILDAVKRALAGETVSTTFVLKDINYDLFIGPERDIDGKVIGAGMLSVDITDRIKVEKEKSLLQAREQAAIETSKMKSDFLATMSHEIRTPINGVLGVTSLLQATNLDVKQKEYAEAIKISGSTLLSVINDILDFSKNEAGKLELEEIDFDFPEFFAHSMKSLSFSAAAKDINLTADIDPLVPQWVQGDPNRFRQILNNLVSNAIKFTENGEVTVRVAKSLADFGRAGIRVEVSDTGIGMDRETVQRMFKPFTQAEASMSRRFGGTGLGLSICKQLVEKMGGDIGVHSNPGVGSMFWFTVPFRWGAAPKSTIVVKTPAVPAPVKPNSIPRILVAEDNRINQMVTTAMLKQMGCESVVVINGIEALEALEAIDFDLVLMDYQMPKMDGLEATRLFRAATHTRNKGLPILAMTANAMQTHKEECLGAGMDDFITKPVSAEGLTAVISRWLDIQRQKAS